MKPPRGLERKGLPNPPSPCMREPLERWQRIVLANVVALIGFLPSIFVLPGSTPFWLWAAICLSIIAVSNFVLVRRLRTAWYEVPRPSWTIDAIVALGFLVFVLTVAQRYTTHSLLIPMALVVIGMIVCDLIRRDQSDARRVGTQPAEHGERPDNPTGHPPPRA